MKSIKLLSLSILLSVFFMSASFAQDNEVFVANANFKVNATCGSCKAKVEKALLDTEGVKTSDMDISTFVVSVGYDESLLTKEDIVKVIADAGYTAEIVATTSNTTTTGGCTGNTYSSGCCNKSKGKSCNK